MKRFSLSLFLLISFGANAGCPSITTPNVPGKLLSCQDVKSPHGSVIEFQKNENGEKLKLFIYPDQKFVCKVHALNTSLCLSLQKWCPMVGKIPHGVDSIAFDLRPKCSKDF